MHLASEDSPQASFYDHISNLMNIFKELLNQIQILSKKIKEDQQFQGDINGIKKSIMREEETVQRFNVQLQKGSEFDNVFQRFLCRVIEIIVSHKEMHQRCGENSITLEFYVKMEHYVNLHRAERNISRIFKKIYHFILKYCEACLILLNLGTQSEAIETFKKLLSEQKIKSQQSSTNSAKPIAAQQQETAFHKFMILMNRRFCTINCLDIDYNSYKSYCFMSRNNEKQLYNDYKYRNYIPFKMATRYSKQFSQYLKRKDRITIRRKNLRSNKKVYNPVAFEKAGGNEAKDDSCLQMNKEQENSLFPSINAENDNFIQRRDETKRKDEMLKNARRNYQMKNVLISMMVNHVPLSPEAMFKTMASTTRHQQNRKKYSLTRMNRQDLSIRNRVLAIQINNQSFLRQQKYKREMQDTFRIQRLHYTKKNMHDKVTMIHRGTLLNKTHNKKKDNNHTLEFFSDNETQGRLQRRQTDRLNPQFYN